MSAHTDAVQTAVVFADHVVLALGHGTVNVAVFLFDLHNDRSSSKKKLPPQVSGERYTFSMPEAGGVMQENFRQHRTKLVRKVRCQIFRQIA